MKYTILVLILVLFIGIAQASYQINVHAFKDQFMGTASVTAKHVGNGWEPFQTMYSWEQSRTFEFYTTNPPLYGSPWGLCTGRISCEGKADEDTVPWNSSGITHIYVGLDSTEPEPDPEPNND